MNRFIAPMILFLMVVSSAILSCGKDTPQEQELKATLLEFQDGVNSKNANKVKDLLSENASIMVGRERKILSKTEYAEILPQRLAENPAISFGKPKMTVSGDKAEVKIYVTRGGINSLVVYHMEFENNKWYIRRWEY